MPKSFHSPHALQPQDEFQRSHGHRAQCAPRPARSWLVAGSQPAKRASRWTDVVTVAVALMLGSALAPSSAVAQTPGATVAPVNDPARQQNPWSVEHWRTSPFHRAQNANGAIIPCRCVFQGQSYRVGEIVCMSTHMGVVLTRCDMNQNITSWVPSDQSCNVSRAPTTIRTPVQLAAR